MQNIYRLFIQLLLAMVFSIPEQVFSSELNGPNPTIGEDCNIVAGCHRPKQGPTGPSGLPGPTGPRGPEGSAAPAGFTTYSSVAANGAFATQTVATGDPIIFNTKFAESGDIVYSTATGQFTVFSPGTYEITFGGRVVGINGDTNPVVAISINGTEIPGTQIDGNINNSNPGADWFTGSFILTINSGQIPATIEIIASALNGAGSIQLVEVLGGATSSAFATVKKISNNI